MHGLSDHGASSHDHHVAVSDPLAKPPHNPWQAAWECEELSCAMRVF